MDCNYNKTDKTNFAKLVKLSVLHKYRIRFINNFVFLISGKKEKLSYFQF